jgi:hypothetical protein
VRVSDLLLEKDCLALVSDGQHVMIADWGQTNGLVTSREDSPFGITNDTITHWMPLPAPPAQEQGES